MTFAPLRRHVLASTLAVSAVLVPAALGSGTAQAVPAAIAESSVKAAAPSQNASAAQRKMVRLEKKSKRSPRALAHLMVERKHNWSHRQFNCVEALWGRESGWRVRAAGAGGSYGIPQATPGRKMGKGWRTSAKVQVRWGLSYIDERYGTPCAANNHSHRTGWY
jgi:hypothetical protein